MDATQFYAIAAGGSIVLLLVVNSARHLPELLAPGRALLQKYFLLPMLIRRHRFVGPWNPAQISFQLIYLAANVFCASFKVHTAKEVSTRASHLSLINMIPTYFGFHLSFVCDLLNVPLTTYRLFHASTGTMSVLLGLLHVLIHAVGKLTLNFGKSWLMFGLIVSLSVPRKRFFTDLHRWQSLAWSRCRCVSFDRCPMKSSFVVIRHWPSPSLMLFGDMSLLPRRSLASIYLPRAAPLRLHLL